MLSRLSDAIGKPFPSPCQTHIFADSSDISSWAIESVTRVYAAGIMNGIGGNKFAPQQSFTREQGIVTIMRIFNSANGRDDNYFYSDECHRVVIERIEISDGYFLRDTVRFEYYNGCRITVVELMQVSCISQLPIEQRIQFLISTVNRLDNVIVGKPIAKVQGDTGYISNRTDYYFKVLNWAFGVPGEEIIIVRHQSDDLLEIGAEYTFAVSRLNNVFFDLYFPVGEAWNKVLPEANLRDLLDTVGRMPVTRIPSEVIEEAVPKMDFVKKNVDVAVIATVTNTRQRIDDFGVLDTRLDLVEVVHGEVRNDAFNQSTMLRGDVTVGSTYLILFSANERGHLRLLARHGAIIPYGSPEFYSFMELFELIN